MVDHEISDPHKAIPSHVKDKGDYGYPRLWQTRLSARLAYRATHTMAINNVFHRSYQRHKQRWLKTSQQSNYSGSQTAGHGANANRHTLGSTRACDRFLLHVMKYCSYLDHEIVL